MSDASFEPESSSSEGKLLTELKVTELRSELEKRGKDKNGVKATLTDRLSEALEEEGHDPSSYLFTVTSEATPVKGSAAKRKSGNPSKHVREGDVKAADDVDQENSWPENNTTDTQPPAAANDSMQRLEEADNIVQDALQLAENDELNEYRDIDDVGEADAKASKRVAKAGTVSDARTSSTPSSGTPALGSESKSSRSSRASESVGSKSGRTTDTEGSASVGKQDESVSLIVHVGDTSDPSLDISSHSSASVKKNGKLSSATKKDGDEKSGRSGRDAEKKDPKSSSSSSAKAKSSTTDASNKTATSSTTAPKDDKSDASDRNIWVSGLSQSDRASDLQSIFKNYGKVVGAKIITNTRIPGSRYYGLITMETKEQAEKCIQHLNKTELNGRTITVEKNRPKESSSTGKEKDTKESSSKSHREKDSDREKNKSKDKSRDKGKESSSGKNRDRSKERGRDKETSSHRRTGSKSPVRSRDERKSPVRRHRSRSPFRARGMAARGGRGMAVKRPFIPRDTRMNPAELRRIEADRLARRRERMMRESIEQRRQDEDRRQRELIQIEAEKLRRERELLEKEKAELLRLEREKARLERERIEREKEEILRKVSHERDFSRSRAAAATSNIKRPYDSRDPEPYWESNDRKRQVISDPLAPAARMTFDSTSAARFEFDSRGNAPAVSQERFPVRGSGDYGMDSRRDNGRPDRDDRARALAAASVSNPGFYRSDLRDSRPDARRPPNGRGDEGNWKNDSRRDRPLPTVSSMISVSGSSVGPQGMYSATTGAPLGPAMSHSSLSSAAPIGAAQMDTRSYVHPSIRRFPS